MDNIKSLYFAARNSGRNSDIAAYNEAVNNLLNSDPNAYLSNLEYIISSSSGVKTFKEFVDKYGFSLSLYDEAMSYVDQAIGRCSTFGKDDSSFVECKDWMESFRKDNIHAFAMYEWYKDDSTDDYRKSYYSFNEKGIQNSKLPLGMMKAFKEEAIPDIIITAKNIGDKTLSNVTKYIESYGNVASPLFYEYLSTVAPISEKTKAKTASAIYESVKARNHQLYRESVITGNMDAEYEYSQSELDAIEALISFDEYKVLWADEFNESVDTIQREVYDLYEELDGIDYEESTTNDSKKSKDDLVPIFILLRHYDENVPDELKNDEDFKRSVNLCKLINKLAKGDQYSHCVISFDEDMTQMYSFEANGIVHDSLDTKFWKFISSVYMSVMFIKKEQKDKLLKMCKDFVKNPETTSYAYSELVRMYLGKPIKASRNFICSSFAAYLLAAADPKNLHRDYSRMRPEDIELLPRTFYVANWKNGTDIEKKKSVIHNKVKAIEKEHMEELKDYNNELPRYLLQDTCKKKKFFDKIIDYIVGTKMSASMGGSQFSDEDKKDDDTNDDSSKDKEIKESYESIFVESAEDKGVLYKSYKPLLGYINAFLTIISDCVDELNSDPDKVKINLGDKIDQFKKDIAIKPEPGPIVISKINRQIKTIKDYRSNIDKSLKAYADLKNKISYGGNIFRSILHRPKVLDNSIDPERYDLINNNIRNVNRAMDWIEKCFIDLYNFVDQDLDILNIINRVYIKQHIYEGVNCVEDGEVDEDCADSVVAMLPQATNEGTGLFTSPHAFFNTHDKKTGGIPNYLKNNHDMASYGEDDPSEEEKDKSDDDATLDDYKRPSADDDTSNDSSYDDTADDDDEVDISKDDKAVNNYYYYTYTNSLNRNRDDHSSHKDDHSYNDDHSVHKDDHSSHSVDDHSTKTDDHSSRNYYDHQYKHSSTQKNKSSKEDDFHELESVFKLDVPTLAEPIAEDVAPVEDRKPKSDHPVKDTFMDIDRKTTKLQQGAKRGVQNIQNAGRAAMKPINRTKMWLGNMISNWKDKSETQVKEDMADPHSRSLLFKAIRTSIEIGALWQAGLLLNPVFLCLAGGHAIKNHKDKFRLRNEMIGELKTEMNIVDEKIQDADRNGDNQAKYKLMRFKNELNKKLLRVGGSKGWSKIF